MPRIYVEFVKMRQIANTTQSVSSKLDDLRSDFLQTVQGLDWEVKFQSNINSSANQIAQKLRLYDEILRKYHAFLNDAYSEYVKLDQFESIKSTNLTSSVLNKKASEENTDSQFLALIKSLLSWGDKTGTSDKAGLGKDGLSYLESLYNFFSGDKSGLTGAEDWFDLGDKSIGLWTEFYDYLKDFYNETGNTFSVANQKSVAGLGIASGIFGLISSAFGTADTINSDNIGTAGVIGEILGGGKNVVDIWGGVEKLKHIGDTATNITTKEGLYSPLSFYSTIAKGYISAFSQGFTSYEKYAADGVWDVDDTAKTGVEFAVSGLYSMINSLSFGLISEKTTGITADNVSESLESWAGDVGTKAGNYILNDAALHDAYSNSGTIGQVAITFYAAFKSMWN